MHIVLVLLTVLLSGCGGHNSASWSRSEEAYLGDSPTPNVTNDGFYDGGVFDQDEISRDPGDIM